MGDEMGRANSALVGVEDREGEMSVRRVGAGVDSRRESSRRPKEDPRILEPSDEGVETVGARLACAPLRNPRSTLLSTSAPPAVDCAWPGSTTVGTGFLDDLRLSLLASDEPESFLVGPPPCGRPSSCSAELRRGSESSRPLAAAAPQAMIGILKA